MMDETENLKAKLQSLDALVTLAYAALHLGNGKVGRAQRMRAFDRALEAHNEEFPYTP